jgi:hypothetical protein
MGEECVGGSCVPARPTLYSHIQLASALLRNYNSEAEKDFRATHADLLIGQTVVESDGLRAANPNVRLITYFTNRYHLLAAEADAWCAAQGVDAEDFYLHYREDVYLAGYSQVLVPGYPIAFVPGWNPNAQPGGPASAASRAESRAYGAANPSHEPWPLANYDNPHYRAFAKDYIRRKVEGTVWGATAGPEPLDGVMMDHGVFYPGGNEGLLNKTDEFYGIALDDNHPYGVAFETFYPELREYLNGLFHKGIDVVPNYGHVYFLSQTDRFSQGVQDAVDWAWGEVWVTHRNGHAPIAGTNRVISYEKDYERSIAAIARQSSSGKRRILGARDLSSGTAGSDRGRLFTLALYYLVANTNTFYAYETATTHKHGADLSLWQWNPAVQADIGKPAQVPGGMVDFDGNRGTTEHYVMEIGPDPVNGFVEYTLLARRFDRGLVLAKMLPNGSTTDDTSVTHHDLGGSYRIVQADGSLGLVTTTASLRNNEGVIYVAQ